MRNRVSDSRLAEIVRDSISMAEVLRKLGLRPAGGNYQTFGHRIARLHLDTTHWLTQASLRGTHHHHTPSLPLESVLVEHSGYNSYDLKNRIIAAGLVQARCTECGLSEWRGRPIPLELDHINGVHSDNRFENLRLLCPNCHAQAPHYRGKNKHMKAPPRTCMDCGKVISRAASRCPECAAIARSRKMAHDSAQKVPGLPHRTKIDWPPVEQLLQDVAASSYSAVARRLGVSGNAIRKHLRRHA